jgi:hypothetical protein
MAEVRQLIEKFRGGDRGGMEELIAAMTLMQGNMDMNSFMAGLLFGKGGGRGGMDRSMALIMAMSAANQQQQSTATGVVTTTNPMQQLLPLLLLFGRDDCDADQSVEFVEKKASGSR